MAEQERARAEHTIATADGALRELEKEALAAHQQPAQHRPEGGVTSLGKAGDGAPEEDAADISAERTQA